MTIADTINRMIEKAMLSAYIDSPRFDDYKIRIVEEVETPNLEGEIRDAIKQDPSLDPKVPKQTKIDQEMENILSQVKAKKPDREIDQALEAKIRNVVESTVNNPNEARKRKKELDADIQGILENSDTFTKLEKTQKDTASTLDKLNSGNLGKIQQMTSQQIGNVISMASDPFQFLIGTLTTKLARGAGIVAFGTMIYAAVQWVLTDLQKPGKPFDRQFKRRVREEFLTFTDEQTQRELRQGFKSVIITSLPYLRGGAGHTSGNLYNPTAIPATFIDPRHQEVISRAKAYGARGGQKFQGRGGR